MPDNRSRWKIFREDVLGIRVKAPDNSTGVHIASKGETLGDELLKAADTDVFVDASDLDKLRIVSDTREQLYKVYDEMKLDSIIASALEMYADDATQYNRDGKIIWVDSDDTEIAQFGNRLVDILDLNKNCWEHIYALCLYGDLYLETFTDLNQEIENDRGYSDGFTNIKKPKKGSVMEESVEMVNNPCEIFDLVKKDKTVGFVKIPVEDQSDFKTQGLMNTYTYQAENTLNKTVCDPRNYIHITLSNTVTRFPEKLAIVFTGEDKKTHETKEVVEEYKIKRGKSILYDIYKIYQEVKLMEDAILLNRITRSSIIRLLQVEVGDMTKSQVSNLLKRLKQMMEQRNMLDKDVGRFKSQAAPGPIDNILYIPTRNGKGTVSMSNVGGDVDIKSIADLDYYSNKLFGGLKVPKQFLGFTDDAAGFSGGTSLTKLDARYARTIKRIQNAYVQGITDLLNLFALDKGLDGYVNNFKVRMVSPATTEDAERDETMGVRLDLISSFIELLGDSYTEETKKKVFEYFVNIYLSDNELSDILEEDEGVQDEFADETMEEDGFGTSSGHSMSNDMGGDMLGDFGGDNDFGGGPEDFGNNDTGFEDTGVEETVELGSFDEEGEF